MGNTSWWSLNLRVPREMFRNLVSATIPSYPCRSIQPSFSLRSRLSLTLYNLSRATTTADRRSR